MASTFQTASLFVLVLNVLMFLSQMAIMDINPESSPYFFNESSHLINKFDKGGHVLDTNNLGGADGDLPTVEGSVTTSSGNIFTDIFSNIKKWFAEKTGLVYVYDVLSAPYNLIKALNLPQSFTYALGVLWYGISLFALVAFIWGRH